MNRNQEINVSNKVVKELKEKGFIVHKHYAKTTRSIYLKLDYGVCCGIRISDHMGKKKYKYKFNLIKQYKGPKKINDRGYIRQFYNYNNTNELLKDVQTEKIKKLNKYGLYNYNEYMKRNASESLYKTFKKVA